MKHIHKIGNTMNMSNLDKLQIQHIETIIDNKINAAIEDMQGNYDEFKTNVGNVLENQTEKFEKELKNQTEKLKNELDDLGQKFHMLSKKLSQMEQKVQKGSFFKKKITDLKSRQKKQSHNQLDKTPATLMRRLELL